MTAPDVSRAYAAAWEVVTPETASRWMVWHIHDCPASFDFAQCNYRCRVARAALEGRE